MAKIIAIKSALLAATVLTGASFAMPVLAQTDQELLNMAQEAEGNRYWSAAEKFYRQMLQRNPNRPDLWERLGDIIAAQGRPVDAARAFGRAANLAPNDLRLQTKAANAHSAVSKPEEAITFLTRAVAIDPGNAENWYAKSVNESWIGRYADAENSLKRAMAAGLPRNVENLTRLATLQQWQGKNEESNLILEEVFAQNPEEPLAILGIARLTGWQGNYHKALKLLEKYRANGGDELTYAQEKSILLAWADQPEESLKVSDAALQEHPGDKNLGIGQVIAFYRAGEFDTAFDILEGLENQAAGPDEELAELRRRISTPVRSNLSIGMGFSTDRDNIDIIGGEVVYSQALNRKTFVRFGFEGYRVKADQFSGLDRVDNMEAILNTGFWGEVDTKLAKNFWGAFKLGASFTNFGSPNRSTVIGGVKFTARTSDHLWIKFGYDRDHFMVSPRALSLGIIRSEEFIEFVWVPDPRYFIQARFSAFQNNDTNREKRADLTIIRALSRRTDLKVDVGFNGVWYGYKFDLANGYYDPSFYQRYLFPLYFTIKISDDDNMVFTFAPGMQKDETFNGFKFAGVATLETTHGLFMDWQFKTKWSVYAGGAQSALNLAPTTNYWVVAGSFVLVRRF
ncbi:MAG: tetratricopeptide repeat protein [Sphingomonadales bacterium]